MRWYAVLRMRVGSLLHRRRLDAELEEELRGHVEREAEQAGAAEAWRRFAPGGGLDAVRDACREARGWTALENFAADFRRAARRLASSPGFGLTAVAVLTLGVAAASAMFSVCDAVLLEPLPGVDSAAGLVHLERYDKNVLLGDFSYPDYLDYRDQSRSYAALAATSNFEYDIRGRNGTETVNAEMVSANYFQALGLGAERGRLFRRGDNRVVVVSDHYWRSRLGANPDAIGGTLTANQTALTVIGVAAPGFHGATQTWDADLWVPITLQPLLSPMGATGNCLTARSCGWVTIFGRLKAGVSLARAQAEAATVAARVAAAHPEIAGRRAAVVPGLGSWSDDRATQARFLAMLLAGTLLLAAMTSASLGSLFLARMGGRQHEVVTQLALGASRWRVARQFGFEAVLVAAPGAALGAVFAAPLARRLVALAPAAPQNLAIAADGRVWAFAALLAALSALAMALAPALLSARRGQLTLALQTGSRTASAARHSAQRALLVTQLSLALLLLVAASLAGRTLQAATSGQVPPQAGRVVLGRVDTGHALNYTRAQDAVFFDRLRHNLAAQPGLAAVALSACLAPSPCNRGPVFAAGAEPPEAVVRSREFLDVYPRPYIDWISPEYFEVFGVPLVAGRDFTEADRAGAPLVCIVNQSLAARLWPHESALGRRLAWPQFAFGGDHDFTVVGIAADRRSESLLAPAPLSLWVPAAQAPFPALWVAARSALTPAATLQILRRQVAALDSRIPVAPTRTLADQVRRSLWQPIAIASLAGLFGILAALLAAVGLFGALAQLVQERRRELGIRMALGATPQAVMRLVVSDSVRTLLLGLGAGAVAGALALRALQPWLFGVTPADPLSWAAAALLLTAAALAGAGLAARRAARVAPAEALRAE